MDGWMEGKRGYIIMKEKKRERVRKQKHENIIVLLLYAKQQCKVRGERGRE